MLYKLFNIFLLLAFSLVFISLIQRTWVRWLVAFVLTAFTMMEVVSFYISGEFINYAFYTHFNFRDIFGIISVMKGHAIIACVLFIAMFLGLYFSKYLPLQRWLESQKYLVIASCVLLIIPMGFRDGVIDSALDMKSMFTSRRSTFEESLRNLGMENYITPDQLKATPGKNIVVISLESYEKGYLHESRKDLTPNLRQLRSEWNYIDMKPNKGSSWTSASLYTSLTGLPAFFNVYGNAIFKHTYDSKITGVTHVLDKAGYQTAYLTSDAEFSGMKDLLNTYQVYDIIDQHTLDDKYELSNKKEIHDKDLFEEAKQKLKALNGSKKPFALFISTTSTHWPNGIYDPRMESVVEAKKSDLEFMVASVDYMVGDFINVLKEKKLLENTAVYVFPDHLKMAGRSVFSGTGEAGLFVITNADVNNGQTSDSFIYQLELPGLLLAGAKVNHNARFLGDYIKGDKNDFIKENIATITNLNTSGLKRSMKSGNNFFSRAFNKIAYRLKPVLRWESINMNKCCRDDVTRFIAHAGGKIKGYRYTNSLEALNKSYKNGLRLFELDIIKTSDGKFVAAHDWNYWASKTGYKGNLPPTEKQFLTFKMHNKFTPLNMEIINKWFMEHPDAILVTDGINEPGAFSDQFIDKSRLMMELFSFEALKEGMEAGIRSVIASQNLIESFGENKFSILHHLNIRYIAVSRTFIEDNIELMLRLKEHHIKAFLYHVNEEVGKDEYYVMKYDLPYAYGMYVDSWKINQK